MKLTPWYPGHIWPVRVGLYERKYPADGNLLCFWNGRSWEVHSPPKGMKGMVCISRHQYLPWRGLKEKASGAAIGGEV